MLIYNTSLVSESKHGGTADARERNVFASKQRCMSWLVAHYTCGKWKGASFVGKNREGKIRAAKRKIEIET